jgi:hypothetical protein
MMGPLKSAPSLLVHFLCNALGNIYILCLKGIDFYDVEIALMVFQDNCMRRQKCGQTKKLKKAQKRKQSSNSHILHLIAFILFA